MYMRLGTTEAGEAHDSSVSHVTTWHGAWEAVQQSLSCEADSLGTGSRQV